MINKGIFTSNKQTWETPQDLFDKLNKVFNFNLDVCATKETAKCEEYFTPEIDGLSRTWFKICWMNPPYNREQIKWIKKAYSETKVNGICKQVVCLILARPDTKVWHEIIFTNAVAICFIKGRLKFSGSKDSAPFPSALIVFGSKLNSQQIDCLNSLGKVFIK